MSKLPSVPEVLDLARRLQSTVVDFRRRERELLAEQADRANKVELRQAGAAEELETRKQSRIQAITGEYDRACALHEARHRARRERIDAIAASLADRVDAASHAEIDRARFLSQKESLEAARERDADTKTAHSVREGFQQAWRGENARLQSISNSLRRRGGAYSDQLVGLDTQEASEEPDPEAEEHDHLGNARDAAEAAEADLVAFQTYQLPGFFRMLPLGLLIVLLTLLTGGAVFAVYHYQLDERLYPATGVVYLISVITLLLLHLNGRRRTRTAADSIAIHLANARLHLDTAEKTSALHHAEEIRRITESYDRTISEWEQALAEAEQNADNGHAANESVLDIKTAAARQRNDDQLTRRLAAAKEQYYLALEEANQAAERETVEFAEDRHQIEDRLSNDRSGKLAALNLEWRTAWGDLMSEADRLRSANDKCFPEWTSPLLENWQAPESFALGAHLGDLTIDTGAFEEAAEFDSLLEPPNPVQVTLPLVLRLPDAGSLLLETRQTPPQIVNQALNQIVLRLLAAAPAGRLSFTIIDPVGLGQNFAGFMHLADYEDSLINGRIWTEAAQIESRLKDLNEHMEKVIQMYLRNEYADIVEYNEKAGNIAEKYHFLVVADFPTGFSETAAKRLQSIASSGARCGVYTLIHWDQRKRLPQDFSADDLRRNSISLNVGDTVTVRQQPVNGGTLRLAPPPPDALTVSLIHRIGHGNKDSNRIEVPFEHVAPPEDRLWTESTARELRVAIGRTGATKLQHLAIGRDTCQHALVAGKTGSGKSTLFHVVITNLALWCSPDEIEFYLIDFKKGVEFRCYAQHRLPHARVVAIESDREFGLSVLERVDEELKRRGEIFRKLGVQDLAGYRASDTGRPMPRSLLLIDEFQEFFTEDDRIAQNAATLLDRIVRQGRAFGIHVMLGSQTLGGAHTLPRPTMGQMVIRIALACNEADSYIILDDSNPAARHLHRPGEGIYNDAAGALSGNSPFQVVWLPDEVRDRHLKRVTDRAAVEKILQPRPIVFEGNAPANVAENDELTALLMNPADRSPQPALFLGAPNAIKGPTRATFARQSGGNLMIIGQHESANQAILTVGLVGLAGQFKPGRVRVVFLDGSTPETPEREYLDHLVEQLPYEVDRPGTAKIGESISGLAADLQQRIAGGTGNTAPRIFLVVHGLQKFKKLRNEDDFSFSLDAETTSNPGADFETLMSEGPAYGIHVIVTIDTLNNINRALTRKAQGEFEMRVLHQMSANDSSTLIDTPAAANLGLHRALFHNEQLGQIETFRPYAVPPPGWITRSLSPT